MPTPFIHGGADQSVPVADASKIAIRLVKNATPKVDPGGPHGLCTTMKNKVDTDLLSFFCSWPHNGALRIWR